MKRHKTATACPNLPGTKSGALNCIYVVLLLLVSGTTDRVVAAVNPQAPVQSTTLRQHAMQEMQAAAQMGLIERLEPQLATADAYHPQSSSSRMLQAQQQQQQQQLPRAPEWLLAKGFKSLAPSVLRNWCRFADKVNTPGSNVTLVTFGGSITGAVQVAARSTVLVLARLLTHTGMLFLLSLC
jgi:hypothetical protein